MYGMINSVKVFSDELIDWLLEAGFILSQCQMYIYYKYAPDGTKFLFYLMLINVSIVTLLKLLGNVLWVI